MSDARASENSASGPDFEDHPGSSSSLNCLTKAQDLGVAPRSPHSVGARTTRFFGYWRMRAERTGNFLLFCLAGTTFAALSCLAFMVMRLNETVVSLEWRLARALVSRIYRGD
ncbi:uncharacterized protein [Dermacentor andersoni]|uniref:uncharacterized protein n=1 Tax=Dermacentor andersoni TaxID=34620 RepID=UPI002418090E|nr:uncharacterized protein LOC129380257 [Dermacentor andersoni]